VATLAGIQPEFYDCCPNSCCCYSGPHEHLRQCPYCNEPQYRADGKPRKKFTYIPLIPCLTAFTSNQTMATKMKYRGHEHKHTPRRSTDVFDGSHYRTLCKQQVEIDGKTLRHKYFDDVHDVVLGLSTDGFVPFKRCKNTAWPLIIFNYNLPPEV
jgi:hypothetical protein